MTCILNVPFNAFLGLSYELKSVLIGLVFRKRGQRHL